MFQPRKWWLGLVPLAALWAAGNWIEQDRIATDVRTRALEAAERVGSALPGVAPLNATVEGRDVSLVGAVRNEALQSGVVREIDAQPGVRRVASQVELARPHRPWVWSATREGQRLTLAGVVPDEATRAEILAAAGRIGQLEIVDQQRIAFGAPEGFAGATAAGLAAFAELASGKVTLTDSSICVEGVATTPEAYVAALDRAGSAPAGYQRQPDCALQPPIVTPYVWSATKGADGVLVLSGLVPDDAVRAQIVAAAGTAIPGAEVTDRMLLARGAPAAFSEMVPRALGHLARLREGSASLSGSAFSLTGRGPDTYDACNALLSSLGGALAQGFSAGAVRIDCPPPPPVPLAFTAQRQGTGVVLTGLAPSAAARGAVVEAARAAGLPEVSDRLSVTQNLSPTPDYAAATGFVLGLMPHLATGQVSLAGSALSVSGQARDTAAKDRLEAALAGPLPGGLQPGRSELTVPLAFSAAKTDEGITLSGLVPSEEARERAIEAARAATPGRVVDRLVLRPDLAPNPDFAAVSGLLLRQLASLSRGEVSLNGVELAVIGEALPGAPRPELDPTMGGTLPEGLRLRRAEVSTPPPAPALPFVPPPPVVQAPAPPAEPAPVPAVPAPAQPEPAPPAPSPASPPPRAQVPAPPAEPAPAPAAPAVEPPAPIPAPAPAPPVVVDVPPPPPPPPPPVAFEWRAVKSAAGIVLSGLVPSDAVKAALRRLALAATSGSVDDSALATRENVLAEPDPAAAGGFALEQLARLRSGEARIAAGSLTLSGETPAPEAIAAIIEALKQPPAGLAVAPLSVAVRPYGSELQFDRGGAVLRGYLPDQATRDALLGMIAQRQQGLPVQDETVLSAGAPEGYGQALLAAASHLLRLDIGTLRLAETEATLQGLTCRDVIRREVETGATSGLPAGYAGRGDISLRQTGCNDCQADLDKATRDRSILFTQGSARIGEDVISMSVIDDVARVLQVCPSARVAVEGHTNADGERRGFPNQALSERRAAAVIERLLRYAIPEDRLSAVGFGPGKPLLPHDTPEGREQNRRVQFTILNP